MRSNIWKMVAYSVAAGLPVSAVVAQEVVNETAIHLSDGRVSINGQEQAGTYSAYQSRFKFMYFYVPSHGLFIVSSKQFGEALEAGTFARRQLQFELSGIDFKLVASRTILGKEVQPAWVRFDPNFKLNVDSIMFGYGDTESVPYDWPQQLGEHI